MLLFLSCIQLEHNYCICLHVIKKNEMDIAKKLIRLDLQALTLNRQTIQFEFSPTWSCVSLTRSTASSEWKLFRFAKMEVNSFQILLVDVTVDLYHI